MLAEIIGIDPGTLKTGICRIEHLPEKSSQANIIEAVLLPNAEIAPYLKSLADRGIKYATAIEGLVSYGNVWGDSTIQTAYLIGRLLAFFEDMASQHEKGAYPFDLFQRKTYVLWLTGSQVKDKAVKEALEHMYGSYKKDGPLAQLVGPTSDKRSAFALAKYYEYRMAAVAGGNTNFPPSLYVPLGAANA
jgi:hypothetical protein